MEITKEDFESFRDEIRQGFSLFRQEVKDGFANTHSSIAATNERLDQTNARLDQTNARLDETIVMVRDFRKDVSTKLDGIGNYLQSLDGNIAQQEERIRSLELRVDRLEETG